MITKQNRRVRTAVLTGFAALSMAFTGACNDTSPAEAPPANEQEGEQEEQDDDGGDEDGGGES